MAASSLNSRTIYINLYPVVGKISRRANNSLLNSTAAPEIMSVYGITMKGSVLNGP